MDRDTRADVGAFDVLLAELDDRLDRVRDAATSVRNLERGAAEALSTSVVEATRTVHELRSLAATLVPAAADGTRPELETALAEVRARLNDRIESARRRLRELVEVLRTGHVHHAVPRIARKREQLRVNAADEVEAAANAQEPPLLPGPADAREFMRWACGLEAEQMLEALGEFEELLPSLIELVADVAPDEFFVRLRPATARPAELPTIESDPAAEAPSEALPLPIETVAAAEAPKIAGDAPAPETKSDVVMELVEAPEASEAPDEVPVVAQRVEEVASEPPHEEPRTAPAVVVEAVSPVAPGRDDSAGPAAPIAPEPPEEKPATLSEAASPPAHAPRTSPSRPGFDEFRGAHLVLPDGRVARGPWLDGDRFAAALNEAAQEAMGGGRLGHVWLFARAVEDLGAAPVVPSGVVERVAAVIDEPASLLAGVDPERAARIAGGTTATEEALRIELCLEAVRPGRAGALAEADVHVVLGLAPFESGPLARVVESLLSRGLVAEDPVAELRTALVPSSTPTVPELEAALHAARTLLHEHVTAQWSACRGRVERTHCRQAWSEWIDAAKPVFEQLYPPGLKGAAAWDAAEVATHLQRLEKQATRIFERYGAKLKDRKVMDRTAAELLGAARGVNSDFEALLRARLHPAHPHEFDRAVLEAARQILDGGDAAERGDEKLCSRLLRHLLAAPSRARRPHPFGVGLAEVALRPGLLELVPAMPTELLDEVDLDGHVVARVTELSQPVRAAAIVLEHAPARASGTTLRETLRETLSSRRDLAARLGLQLPPDDALFPRSELEALIGALHNLAGELRSCVRELDTLASAQRRAFDERLSEAEERLADESAIATEALVFEAWVRGLLDAAREDRRAHVEGLRAAMQGRPAELVERFEEALSANRLADAVFLAHEGGEGARASVRETLYRAAAAVRFGDARAELKRLRADEKLKEFLDAWLEGVSGQPPGKDRTLRRLFAEYVFPNPKDFAAKNESQEFAIDVRRLRSSFAEKGLNPTFLPQLASYQQLVLLTPPAQTSARDFVTKSADFAAKRADSIVVVLAPGLAPDPRDELVQEFHSRKLRACVLDDLDLARLVGAGAGQRPNGPVALLELFLEQQRWREVSPFVGGEGQHVTMEMFVGRTSEADRLATSVQYSRVFSGRKLGKSALLRFVEQTRDGRSLPSGSTLRVVYVPAVGVDEEARLVAEIEKKLDERLQFRIAGLPAELAAAERLERIVEKFLQTRATDSLLLVLDEADAFVERQVEQYAHAKNPEACLSFHMRSRLESIRDPNGHPRVRFVFVGYRATHTSDGAWANWGEVLLLKPLSPEDASRLAEGPLARLGIDASRVAPMIAWRCGYQPAVLLAFGRQLLDHLDQTRPARRRDEVVVSEEDVAATFNHPSVQNEIRTVVRNNFQGHPEADVVFAALLQELADCAPGEPLEDAPTRLVERLRKADADLTWLRADAESARTEVARLLREFVDRELLVDAGSQSVSRYRLRFPHHLSALKPREQEGYIRDQIRSIREHEPRGRGRGPRSLISRAEIELFQAAISEPAERGVRACVAASLWPEALTHAQGGLAARLGFPDPSRSDPSRAVGRAIEPRLLVEQATPEVAGQLLSRRPTDLPPPVLAGGVDLLRWALRRQRETDDVLELAAVGRISSAGIGWWFRRMRGFEFESGSTIEEVASLTGGIPLLVAAVDHGWVTAHATGVNLGPGAAVEARRAVELALSRIAGMLVSGPPSTRLLARELELLRMAFTAVQLAGRPVRLAEDLVEWDDLYTGEEGRSVGTGDRDALDVLERLGLLPVDPDQPSAWPIDRLAVLAPEDPVLRIIGALPAQGHRAA